LQVTGDNDLDWTTRGHRTSRNISAISAKQATSEQVNVRGLFLFHLGKTVQMTYDTIVYRSLRNPALPDSFGPPGVTPCFCHLRAVRHCKSGTYWNGQRTLLTRRFVGLRLRRHKRYFLDHNSRPKSLRHLRRCLHTAREASARCVSPDGSTIPWFPAFSCMSVIVTR
jgi:hypothetical protein